MRARLAVAAAAVGCVAALAASGCSRTADVGKGNGYVYADDSTALVKAADHATVKVAMPATTLTGGPTPSVRGKVVLLNVWASWCGPCRREATALQRVADDLGRKGVVVLGVNTRDQAAAATAFVDRFGITYPSVVDRDGSDLLGAFAGVVPRVFTPTSIVLDARGRVAGWALGEASYSRLRGLLDPLLAEAGATK